MEYTIEPSRPPLEGFTVYKWGVYPRGSVLAGQTMKQFVAHFSTVELAQQAYPQAEQTGRRSAHNTFNHLPGEDDPVPGGMYRDDIGGNDDL